MKKYLLMLLIVSFALIGEIHAQQVVITSKKTTYRRKKADMDFKRTFTVNQPIVKAATPALSRRIGLAISYATNEMFDLREELSGEYQWLEEADFEVRYNKNGILTVALTATGTAAYPTTNTQIVNVDSRTGNKLKAGDLLTNLDGLAKLVKGLQAKEVKETIERLKKDPDFGDDDPARLFESTDFTAADLDNFEITENGVQFNYDYGFPHVIQAVEPDGQFLFKWSELKPFIKPAGLLGRFVR